MSFLPAVYAKKYTCPSVLNLRKGSIPNLDGFRKYYQPIKLMSPFSENETLMDPALAGMKTMIPAEEDLSGVLYNGYKQQMFCFR